MVNFPYTARHSLFSQAMTAHGAGGFLAIAALFLALNFSVLPQAWTGSFYNEKRLLVVLILSLYALILILLPPARTSWRMTLASLPYPARAGFAAVLGLGLLSTSLAARPEAALLEVANFALLFVLAIGIATWVRNAGLIAFAWFVLGLAVTALAYEVRFLAGWLVSLQEQVHFDTLDFFPGFINVRNFNQVLTWTLPLLALPFWLAKRSVVSRTTTFAILAFWWLLLYVSASRGGFLAACGGAVLTLSVFRCHSLPWLKIQALAASAAAIGYFAFLSRIPHDTAALPQRLSRAFEDPTRVRLLHDAWGLFARDPVLGAGPMHYAYYFHDSFLSPHNSPIQLLAEWGLPATLILLALSLWGMFAWIRYARLAVSDSRTANLIRVSLLASVGAAALDSVFNGVIITPLSQLLAACVLGLMLGEYLEQRSGATLAGPLPEQGDRFLVAGLVSAVLALGSLSTLTLLQALELRRQAIEAYMEFPSRHSALSAAPRFWFPGQLKGIEKEAHKDATTER